MEGGFRRSARIAARRTSLESTPTGTMGTKTPKTMPLRTSAGREWRETLAISKMGGVQDIGAVQPLAIPWDWTTLREPVVIDEPNPSDGSTTSDEPTEWEEPIEFVDPTPFDEPTTLDAFLFWAFRIIATFIVFCTCVTFFTISLQEPQSAAPEIELTSLSLLNISKDMMDLQQGFQKSLESSHAHLDPRIAKTLSEDTLHILSRDIKKNGPLEDFKDAYSTLRDRLDETEENLGELEARIPSDLRGLNSAVENTLRGVKTLIYIDDETQNIFKRLFHGFFLSTPKILCREHTNQMDEKVRGRFLHLNSSLESLERGLLESEAIGRIYKTGLKLSQEHWAPGAAKVRRESFKRVFKDNGVSVKIIQDAVRRVKKEKEAVEKVEKKLGVLKERCREDITTQITRNKEELGEVVDLLEGSLRDLELVIKRAEAKASTRKASARGHAYYRDVVDRAVQRTWASARRFTRVYISTILDFLGGPILAEHILDARTPEEKEKEERLEKKRVEREERARVRREKEERERKEREKREEEKEWREHQMRKREQEMRKMAERDERRRKEFEGRQAEKDREEAQEKQESDLNRYMMVATVWCLFWAWMGY